MSDRPVKFNALPQTREYDVGYGKPPAHTRFKSGQSGNPKGRPRGAKNKRPALHEERWNETVLDEAYRSITVRDGNRNVSMPMVQAVVRSIAVNAAKGQHRSQKLFAQMVSDTEQRNRAAVEALLQAAIKYKATWEDELRQREVLGIRDLPPPLPHPDQVEIDFNTGSVWIHGPTTKEEVAWVKLWREQKNMCEQERKEALSQLKQECAPDIREALKKLVQQADKTIGAISKMLDKIEWKGEGG